MLIFEKNLVAWCNNKPLHNLVDKEFAWQGAAKAKL